ncbi:FkbM family methyltransferase [Sphingomonas naphthae]|uniref:FkbM family methyltransferase n=1 Tax=Sphingomonas naphthae TaxID=1813468 RepID=A0ABY7TG42_9SPHN|nr:FkbM family methyltransferase [Sphingomonas naphthae]WCT72028.1 FkbM family methyltransferase [Sphingomonas naphthae]
MRGLWERVSGKRSRRMQRQIEQLTHQVHALEAFSHGSRATYMGNNRVLVKAVMAGRNFGFMVEADDRLIAPWFIITGQFEPVLTNYFIRVLKPGDHCIDAGCNFGFYTGLMGRLCPQGQVVGIEADGRVADLARDNLAINNVQENSRIVHAAICDSRDPVTLYRRIGRPGNTSMTDPGTALTDLMGEPAVEPFTVTGVRIDDLAAEMGGRVDHMKIDVEGAEPLAFAGARRTIADNPQLRIVMEWSPDQIRTAGFDLSAFLGDLAGMGLKPFDIVGTELAPLSFADLPNVPPRPGIVLTRG